MFQRPHTPSTRNTHLSPPLQVPAEDGQQPCPRSRGHLESVELRLEPGVERRDPGGVELVQSALVRVRERRLLTPKIWVRGVGSGRKWRVQALTLTSQDSGGYKTYDMIKYIQSSS